MCGFSDVRGPQGHVRGVLDLLAGAGAGQLRHSGSSSYLEEKEAQTKALIKGWTIADPPRSVGLMDRFGPRFTVVGLGRDEGLTPGGGGGVSQALCVGGRLG